MTTAGTPFPQLRDVPALVAGVRHCAWLSGEGEIENLDPAEAARRERDEERRAFAAREEAWAARCEALEKAATEGDDRNGEHRRARRGLEARLEALGEELRRALDGRADAEALLSSERSARRDEAAALRAEAAEALRGRGEVDERLGGVALRAEQQRELTPDVATFTAVINACERSRQWEAALLLMEEMRRNGFEFYDVPVLDGLFKQGVRVWSEGVQRQDEASSLFSQAVRVLSATISTTADDAAGDRVDDGQEWDASSWEMAYLSLRELQKSGGKPSMSMSRPVMYGVAPSTMTAMARSMRPSMTWVFPATASTLICVRTGRSRAPPMAWASSVAGRTS